MAGGVVSAAGLAAFVLLGGLSLGLPALPGAVCAVVGACVRRARPDRQETGGVA